MGELGWTRTRWRGSTFAEFNYATAGYWRTWERFAGVPMREICYTMIVGNPYIDKGAKPTRSTDFMRLSIDKIEEKPRMTIEEYRKFEDIMARAIWARKN